MTKRTHSPGEMDTRTTDVVVVGAGPAGLMAAMQLARFGVSIVVIDDRPDKTSAGKADGIQPKTIETFEQLDIASDLLHKGVKVYDISFWNSDNGSTLARTGREEHYPAFLDVHHPFVLLCHQGMVEDVLLNDLSQHGVEVVRSAAFTGYETVPDQEHPIEVTCVNGLKLRAKYVIGADGAHSMVRRSFGGTMEGESSDDFWGVLDGRMDTDFPDLWSKCVVRNDKEGSILIIPRERGLTRLYIHLPTDGSRPAKHATTPEYVMECASKIFAPYTCKCPEVEWFGVYQVGQRVSDKFASADGRVFIVGDAGHTHSPKAAQGMNVSMHDAYNLAWKLAYALNGMKSDKADALVSSYVAERRGVATALIDFDHEHHKAFLQNDPKLLAENFAQNIRFIAGVGAVYEQGALLNGSSSKLAPALIPGARLPPARALRHVDANPVDLELAITSNGSFRVYFCVPDLESSREELTTACRKLEQIMRDTLPQKPRLRPDWCGSKYNPDSQFLTVALVTGTRREDFEIANLPPLLARHRWGIYTTTETLDALRKWDVKEPVVAIVRPDIYVGAVIPLKDAPAGVAAYFEDIF